MLIYFVPHAQTLNDQVIASHGLAPLLKPGRRNRSTTRGPGNQPGLFILDDHYNADLVRYEPENQRWTKRYGFDSFVGTWNQLPPTNPTDLQRADALPGVPVTLLDGQVWTIPLVREYHTDDALKARTPLPRILQQDPDNGRLVEGAVVPQYSTLWERSLAVTQMIFDQITKGTSAEIDDALAEQLVLDLLSTNYQVDASVVTHLQLLTQKYFADIIRAALDVATLEAAIKKLPRRSESNGITTTAGD